LPNGEFKEDGGDDELDLFGDDDDEEAIRIAKEVAQKAIAPKKPKKKVIAMSIVFLEVKPLDSDTNLDDLAQRIFKTVTMDGLNWKTEYKKEPIAFGIEKLVIAFSCEDEKVSVDNDVVEKIEALDDAV
jgi:translation elongation factor EF-1beta